MLYALDAEDGSTIWERNVGMPVSAEDLICTKFDPWASLARLLSICFTALFLDAMVTTDGGTTKKHLMLSLDVDTGTSIQAGP